MHDGGADIHIPPGGGHDGPDAAEIFRALGDPVRLSMMQTLLGAPEIACTTFDKMFPIGKSTISYHVRVLKAAGLISVRKTGRSYFYSLRRAFVERHVAGLLAMLGQLPRGRCVEDAAGVPARARDEG